VSEWFDFAGARFELIDGDSQIAEGVRVVATPGHTVGHQSVIVDTPDGGAVMIGDAAFTADIYREGDKADLSSWRGQYDDAEAWSDSLHRLQAMRPHSIHFCHDTRVVSR
jgi:N-acyl homoserine lactone hydrolase